VRFRQFPLLPPLLLPFLVTLSAQEPARVLPRVTDHAPIIYPAMAFATRVEGPVRLKITTDGHALSSIVVIDGSPLLVKAATENVQTWTFADHVPGTFEVTFDFRLLADKTAFLQEPGVVDIAVLPPGYNESSDDRLSYTLPKSWDLELRTATDDVRAPLTTWTYGPWLRGYILGPRNQERQLANAHMDGDMLGFDTALDDSHGQRLQFSLIGKQVGEGIKGIFLDVWGASGTWTAMPSKPSIHRRRGKHHSSAEYHPAQAARLSLASAGSPNSRAGSNARQYGHLLRREDYDGEQRATSGPSGGSQRSDLVVRFSQAGHFQFDIQLSNRQARSLVS
jgi:hypothetical protein